MNVTMEGCQWRNYHQQLTQGLHSDGIAMYFKTTIKIKENQRFDIMILDEHQYT